jgi:YD repeat-containing protein
VTATAYDASGLPTQIRHANGATVVGDYQYTYDATGRRIGAIARGRRITSTHYKRLTMRPAAHTIYLQVAFTWSSQSPR